MYKLLLIALWMPLVICAICFLVMGGLHIAGGYEEVICRLIDVLGVSFVIGVAFIIVASIMVQEQNERR